MNAIHRLIGMGGDQLVPELLGHDLPEATAARPVRYKALIDEAAVFPGAADLLRPSTPAGCGRPCDVGAGRRASRPAEASRRRRSIDAKTTADESPASKPDPEVFLTAMETGGVDPRRAARRRRQHLGHPGRRAAGSGASASRPAGSASTNSTRRARSTSTETCKSYSISS